MPSFNEISEQQLARLVGTPDSPRLIDLRIEEDFRADPRILPTAKRKGFRDVAEWAPEVRGSKVVVICQKGLKIFHGVAARLRGAEILAEVLAGGHLAWAAADLPLIAAGAGQTDLWVTRHRPKIDRIACPWLIRRFINPEARFLFVPPSEVLGVADRFGATPFDDEGAAFSHIGKKCSFDAVFEAFGLATEPLCTLANVVRAADTNAHEKAPEAAGLLAISVGLSRMYRDDLAQFEAGLGVYDALYRWARDGQEEQHGWPEGQAVK